MFRVPRSFKGLGFKVPVTFKGYNNKGSCKGCQKGFYKGAYATYSKGSF